MKQDALPLPNPEEWMTLNAVATLLKCSRRTVGRLTEQQTLRAYGPIAAPDEISPALYWRPEVMQVLGARNRLAAGAR